MNGSLKIYDLTYNLLAILDDNSLLSAKNIQTSFALNEIPTLSYSMPLKSDKWQYIINENLIRYENEYYFIKLPDYTHDDGKIDIRVECRHLCSALEGIQNGEIVEIGKTATELIKTVLKEQSDGSTLTGWKFGNTNVPSNKFRSLNSNEQSVFSNLVKIAELFNATLQFDSITRTVSLLDIQTDRNIQIRKGKNLKQLNIKYDSNELVTKLYVFGGQDDATNEEINIMGINPTGKSYLEDYSYFTNQGYTMDYINAHPELFLREMTWRANDYVNPQQLYDDAIEKMKTLSKPKVKCTIEGLDLSIFPEYFIDSPNLGEKIYIYDEDLDLIISAKVIKITRDSENPLSMQIEISNEIEYSSMIKSIVDSSSVVKKIVTPQQEILGQYIKEATIGTVQIGDATITNAKISNLEADRIKADKIDVDNLTANQIFTDNLNSVYATIDTLTTNYATIDSLSSLKVKAGNIDAGIINGSIVSIKGSNGRMIMSDNKLQVFDYPNGDLGQPPFERVVLGDVNGDGTQYGLRVRGADGTTALLNETGVTKEGFTDGYNKLTDNSLDPAKLDIGAVITRINDDNTTTITGSKVYLDNETLDVTMSKMNVQSGNKNYIQSSKVRLSIGNDALWNGTYAKASIKSLGNTSYELTCTTNNSDEYGIVFESDVKESTTYTLTIQNINFTALANARGLYVKYLDSLNNIINPQGGYYNHSYQDASFIVNGTFSKQLTTPASTVKVLFLLGYGGNTVVDNKLTVNNIKLELGSVATDYTSAPEDIITRMTIAESNINSNANSITQKVWQSDINTSVNNLKIGGRNLILDSGFELGTISYNTVNGATLTRVTEDKYNGLYSLKMATTTTTESGAYLTVNTVVGESYTFTTMVKCTTAKTIRLFHSKGTDFNKLTLVDGTNLKDTVLVANTWTKVSMIFTATQTSHRILILDPDVTVGTYYVDNMKLEIGKNASDWTPAPEDVQNQIDGTVTRIASAETKITPDSIVSTVSKTIMNSTQTATKVPAQDTTINRVGTGWTNETNVVYTDGNGIYSNVNGDYIEYTFVGTGIEINTLTNTNRGIVNISIDGGTITNYDGYKGTVPYLTKQVAYSKTDLTYGTHKIKILINDKNTSSIGYTFVLDFIRIFNNSAVNSSNVISQINQTANNITIEAEKLNINGAVTFSSLAPSVSSIIKGIDTIDNTKVTYFNFDNNLCSTNGLNPNSGYDVTLRPLEGKFNGSVALEETTTNLTVGVTRYEETDASITYSGTWLIENIVGLSGGADKYSGTTGSYALFTFVGTGVRWYTATNTNMGVAKITLDNGTPTTLDNYASSLTFQKKVYEVTNLTYGTHTLKIEVNGTKNASSTNYFVLIDAFEVLDNTVGSFRNGITNWTKYSNITATVVDSTLKGSKKALKITSIDSIGGSYYIKPTLLANTVYTLSFWVNVVSGVDATHNVCFGLADPSWWTGGVVTLNSSTNGWEKKTITFTSPSTITSPYLYIGYANGSITGACEIYVASIQLEQKAFATSFAEGVRNASSLSYTFANNILTTYFTLNWWSKTHILADSSFYINLYFKTVSDLNNRFYIRPSGDGKTIGFGNVIGGTTTNVTTTLNDTTTWHMWTLSRGSDGNLKLYIDGVYTTQLNATINEKITSINLRGNTVSNYLLDECALFNMQLSNDDIQALFNIQRPLYDPNPSIIVPNPSTINMTLL